MRRRTGGEEGEEVESARERVCVCLAAASFDFLVKSGVGAVVA